MPLNVEGSRDATMGGKVNKTSIKEKNTMIEIKEVGHQL